jgi:HK97 family phage major capsid protein
MTLATEIKRLAELVNKENRDFTAEEKGEWEKVNAAYDLLTRKIELAERQLAVDAQVQQQAVNNPHQVGRRDVEPERTAADGSSQGNRLRRATRFEVATTEQRDLAVEAWARTQMELEVDDEMVEACRLTGVRPTAHTLRIPLFTTRQHRAIPRWANGMPRDFLPYQLLEQQRAQGVASVAAGLALVPEGFVPRLEKAMLLFGGVMNVAEILRTQSGADLPWPTVNDTSNMGALIAENTAVPEQDVVFAETILQSFKYTSKLVKVSIELLQDADISVPDVLGDLLGERLGRILNNHFTVGTGSGQPRGIEVAAPIGVTTSPANTLDVDDIFDMIHSVDPAYRGNARWMLHDNLLAVIRKFVHASQGYLWQPSLQLGEPDRLGGHPIQVNQTMDSAVATGNDVAFFGDLSKYKVRIVREVRLRRLVERYADADQEGFVAFIRADGDMLDAGVPPVKKLRIG